MVRLMNGSLMTAEQSEPSHGRTPRRPQEEEKEEEVEEEKKGGGGGEEREGGGSSSRLGIQEEVMFF